MEIFLPSLITLLTLVIPAVAIAYGIKALTSKGSRIPDVDPGIGTVRRLYFYVVAFVALMMAANGVALIGLVVLEGLFGERVITGSSDAFSWGLALTIIGLPLWGFHWRLITKYVKELPVETRSVVRKVYLYVVLVVSISLVMASVSGAVRFLFGGEAFNGGTWARLVIFGAVWAFHWRLEQAEGQSTPETLAVRRIYLYGVAGVALLIGAVAVGQTLYHIFSAAYEGLTSTELFIDRTIWNGGMKDAFALALATIPVWAAHWLFFAREDYDSVLRQIYLYPFALLGGIITVLTAVGIFLYHTLVWLVGVPGDVSAARHFSDTPAAAAALVVGGSILLYHWYVAQLEVEQPVDEAQAPRKYYRYALAAVGLITTSLAIHTLVSLVLTLITDVGRESLAGDDQSRNVIVLTVTLGALGTPIWAYYWMRIQREIGEGPAEERDSLPRRIFIFGVLGVGMLTLVTAASVLIYLFFRDILDGRMGEFLEHATASISAIAPVAVFLPYYWMVSREDRRLVPEQRAMVRARPRKEVSVLVTTEGMKFISRIETVLGYSVVPRLWKDPDAVTPELLGDGVHELAGRIDSAPGDHVMVIPREDGIEVVSFS